MVRFYYYILACQCSLTKSPRGHPQVTHNWYCQSVTLNISTAVGNYKHYKIYHYRLTNLPFTSSLGLSTPHKVVSIKMY